VGAYLVETKKMDKTIKQKNKVKKTIAIAQIITRAIVALIVAVAIYIVYGNNNHNLLLILFLAIITAILLFLIFKNIRKN